MAGHVVKWLVLLALPACLSLPPRPPDTPPDAAGNDGPPLPSLLFGHNTMFGNPSDVFAGNAYAASFKVPLDASVHSIVVYLDAPTAGMTASAGIYGGSSGVPGGLFEHATMPVPMGSGWLRIPIPGTAVLGGDTYWLAVLCPVSTCTHLRVMSMSPLAPGSCIAPPAASCVDADMNVPSDLPSLWNGQTASGNSLSIYASGQ